MEAGAIPTLAQAKERLAYLQLNGESDFAFTFARLFKAPSASVTQQTA